MTPRLPLRRLRPQVLTEDPRADPVTTVLDVTDAAARVTDRGPEASLDLREPERDTALALLFDSHHAQLVRLAALLGAGQDAEDVVAEAFCQLYRTWKRLRRPEAALPYVRASVINLTRMRLRHQQVVRRCPEPVEEQIRSAEAEVVVREDQREVVAALALLPTRQREAIVLRYWLDLREGEVAEAMGISPGAVKTHTSRAMAALTLTLSRQA